MLMVIRAVLQAVGKDMAVIVKINMRDGFKGGMEIKESLKLAGLLEKEGVHALILSGGFVSKAPMYVMRGKMPVKILAEVNYSLVRPDTFGTEWKFIFRIAPVVPSPFR